MKWWIFFAVSLFLLLTGLILVVLFIHLYVIPRQNDPEFIDTYCTVVGIYTEDGSALCDNETTDYRRFDCVVVKVSYQTGNSTGYGHLREWNEYYRRLSRSTVAKERTCSCHSCLVGCSRHRRPYVYLRSLSGSGPRGAVYGNTSLSCVIHRSANNGRYLTKLQMINIMLWPSLCFVIGFVGAFFSCIFVTHDMASCNWFCSICQNCFSFI